MTILIVMYSDDLSVEMKDAPLIFIANGLGLAIDDRHFQLSSGIRNAIDQMEKDELKDLIKFSFPENIEDKDFDLSAHYTENNEKLAYINMVSMLTRMIKTASGDVKEKLVSEELATLSSAVNSFIFRVADYYNDTNVSSMKVYGEQFVPFADNLCRFIYNRKAHVATTNYDDLLYRYFLNADVSVGQNRTEKIMHPGKDTTLIDGFNREKGELLYNPPKTTNSSWYMHLHGSSRFYSQYNSTRIRKSFQLTSFANYVPHVILNHFDLKAFQISTNHMLNDYFSKFKEVAKKTKEIYVIGYGGEDKHINDVFNGLPKTNFIVVDHADDLENREWIEHLRRRHKLILRGGQNILNYRFAD